MKKLLLALLMVLAMASVAAAEHGPILWGPDSSVQVSSQYYDPILPDRVTV